MEFQPNLVYEPPEERQPEEWIFGASPLKRTVILASKNWVQYLPTPEKQASRVYDPFSCVACSAHNIIEAHLSLMMERDPEVKLILEKLDCLDINGKPDLSDRFLAKVSGTTPGRGNSLTAVAEALRKFGFIGEKFWPKTDDMSEAEYYAEIPQAIKDKALEALKYFDINHEWLPGFQGTFRSGREEDVAVLLDALQYSPAQVAVDGNYVVENGMYGRFITFNHATQYYNQELKVAHNIFDTYDPFKKRFTISYPIGSPKLYSVKKKVMKYKIKGNNAVFQLDPVGLVLVPYGSGKVFKTIQGTVDYQGIEEKDSLEELEKIAPLADWIITESPWDKTNFINSLT